jgi:hypothetical protein
MDIVDWLTNTSSTGLLILMAIPLTLAVLLVAILVYFSRGNSQKTKMKLGFQPKTALLKETMASKPSAVSVPGQPSLADDPATLNLDLLTRSSGVKVMVDPPPAEAEKIDLTARLDILSPSQPPATAPEPSRPVVPILAEPVELLRLLREPQSGQLMIEIAGQRYTRLAEITDKEIGQYVLKLAAQMLAFTNGMVATEAGIKPISVPKVGTAPVPPVISAPPVKSPSPASPPPPASLPPVLPPRPAPVAPMPVRPLVPEAPPPAPRRGLFGRVKSSADEPMLTPLNLADQINQIAQAKLALSPLAATTRLEIVSDPTGGIQIRVNGIPYSSPDDILQPDIRTLIKDSIKQWEKS